MLLSVLPENRKLILNLDDPFLRDRLFRTDGGLVKLIAAQAGRPRIQALHPFTLSEGFAHGRGADPTGDGLSDSIRNLLRLSPFTVNPVKRVIKAPKLYFIDNGMLWALRHIPGVEDEGGVILQVARFPLENREEIEL